MDKNNQGSEDAVVGKSMSVMAFLVVLFTSLPWIGTFMLRRRKAAIAMLLMQVAIVVFYYTSDITKRGIGDAYVFIMLLIFWWLGVWFWGLILTSKVVLTKNLLNVEDVDKNNQGQENLVVSKSMSVMAFWVVLLTSLPWIGAFILKRNKTAIVMLLMQAVLAAFFYKVVEGGGVSEKYFVVLFLLLFSLCVWLWGLILTARVALVYNELSVTGKEIIKTVVSLAFLFVLLCLWFGILSGFGQLL